VKVMKRAACTGLTAIGLLATAACSDMKIDTPTDSESPVLTEGVSITNPRLVLPPVSGNPAAVYFDLSYAGEAGVTLSSVTVEGAGMAMIHQTAMKTSAMTMMKAEPIVLSAETPVTFAPGGLHVMAMQPSDAWTPGGTVKVTLTLSDGATHSFDAAVRAAGDNR
jgi:periplasmic copper chaperone A